jgi:hypothetical protein
MRNNCNLRFVIAVYLFGMVTLALHNDMMYA